MARTTGARNKKPLKHSAPPISLEKSAEEFRELRLSCFDRIVDINKGYQVTVAQLIKEADGLYRYVVYGGAGAFVQSAGPTISKAGPELAAEVRFQSGPVPDLKAEAEMHDNPFLSKFEQTHTL